MGLLGYLFLFFIFSLLAMTGVLLAGFISGNFRKGQGLRDGLAQRIEMLRFRKMLRKRDMDPNQYLHHTMIHDVERQIRICEGCNRIDECDAALAGVIKSDLSFCPNDAAFREIKNSQLH